MLHSPGSVTVDDGMIDNLVTATGSFASDDTETAAQCARAGVTHNPYCVMELLTRATTLGGAPAWLVRQTDKIEKQLSSWILDSLSHAENLFQAANEAAAAAFDSFDGPLPWGGSKEEEEVEADGGDGAAGAPPGEAEQQTEEPQSPDDESSPEDGTSPHEDEVETEAPEQTPAEEGVEPDVAGGQEDGDGGDTEEDLPAVVDGATGGITSPGTTKSVISQAAPEEWRETLLLHNLYRCLHNAPPLVWNEDLATNSAQYAQCNDPARVMCGFPASDSYHSPKSTRQNKFGFTGSFGENIAFGFGGDNDLNPATWGRATKMWYEDEIVYTQGWPVGSVSDLSVTVSSLSTSGITTPVGAWTNEAAALGKGAALHADDNTGGAIGHYTQVIWGESSELGCAGFETAKNVLCQYGVSGNVGTAGFTKHYTANVLPVSKTEQQCAGANDDQYQLHGSVKVSFPGTMSVTKCGEQPGYSIGTHTVPPQDPTNMILNALETPVKEALKAFFSLTTTNFDVFVESKPLYSAQCVKDPDSENLTYEFGFVFRSLTAGKAKCLKTVLSSGRASSDLLHTLREKCSGSSDCQQAKMFWTGELAGMALGSVVSLDYKPAMADEASVLANTGDDCSTSAEQAAAAGASTASFLEKDDDEKKDEDHDVAIKEAAAAILGKDSDFAAAQATHALMSTGAYNSSLPEGIGMKKPEMHAFSASSLRALSDEKPGPRAQRDVLEAAKLQFKSRIAAAAESGTTDLLEASLPEETKKITEVALVCGVSQAACLKELLTGALSDVPHADLGAALTSLARTPLDVAIDSLVTEEQVRGAMEMPGLMLVPVVTEVLMSELLGGIDFALASGAAPDAEMEEELLGSISMYTNLRTATESLSWRSPMTALKCVFEKKFGPCAAQVARDALHMELAGAYRDYHDVVPEAEREPGTSASSFLLAKTSRHLADPDFLSSMEHLHPPQEQDLLPQWLSKAFSTTAEEQDEHSSQAAVRTGLLCMVSQVACAGKLLAGEIGTSSTDTALDHSGVPTLSAMLTGVRERFPEGDHLQPEQIAAGVVIAAGLASTSPPTSDPAGTAAASSVEEKLAAALTTELLAKPMTVEEVFMAQELSGLQHGRGPVSELQQGSSETSESGIEQEQPKSETEDEEMKQHIQRSTRDFVSRTLLSTEENQTLLEVGVTSVLLCIIDLQQCAATIAQDAASQHFPKWMRVVVEDDEGADAGQSLAAPQLLPDWMLSLLSSQDEELSGEGASSSAFLQARASRRNKLTAKRTGRKVVKAGTGNKEKSGTTLGEAYDDTMLAESGDFPPVSGHSHEIMFPEGDARGAPKFPWFVTMGGGSLVDPMMFATSGNEEDEEGNQLVLWMEPKMPSTTPASSAPSGDETAASTPGFSFSRRTPKNAAVGFAMTCMVDGLACLKSIMDGKMFTLVGEDNISVQRALQLLPDPLGYLEMISGHCGSAARAADASEQRIFLCNFFAHWFWDPAAELLEYGALVPTSEGADVARMQLEVWQNLAAEEKAQAYQQHAMALLKWGMELNPEEATAEDWMEKYRERFSARSDWTGFTPYDWTGWDSEEKLDEVEDSTSPSSSLEKTKLTTSGAGEHDEQATSGAAVAAPYPLTSDQSRAESRFHLKKHADTPSKRSLSGFSLSV
ncbi:unnamed protein product [Amoebophrya sp. A120]|nr:unnamed protein product [Amoebophrya sp. A120]|eukprot:GSA120T00014018001.1